MKKFALIILMVSVAAFQIFAEEGKGSNANDKDLQMEPAVSWDEFYIMRDQIREMQKQISRLEQQIYNLQIELSESRGRSVTQDNLFDNSTPQTSVQQTQSDRLVKQPKPRQGSESILVIARTVLILFIIIAIVLFILFCLLPYLKRQNGANRRHGASGKKYTNFDQEDSRDSSSYPPRQSSSYGATSPSRPGFPPTSSSSMPVWNSGISPGFSAPRSGIPQASPPKPPVDEISPLYHSSERRIRRHNSDPGDIFLDVPKSILERLVQGEKVQLAFEKSGSRLSAQFVLVNNNLLYPNFHIFNDDRDLSKENEKVLSMIYSIDEGTIPGFVDSCIPAMVSMRGNGYSLSKPGRLKISR